MRIGQNDLSSTSTAYLLQSCLKHLQFNLVV
jgi:hypothetical protein